MTSIFPYFGLFAVIAFFVLMLLTTKDKNKMYVQFILIAYPFIQFSFNFQTISVTAFDIVTYVFLFTLYRRKRVSVEAGNFYLILFILLVASSFIGVARANSIEELYTARAFITLGSVFIFAKILIDECIADASFFYHVIHCLKINLIISLVFLVGQFVFGASFSIAIVQNPNMLHQGFRYTSFFQDPQKYAQFLAAQSFLLLIKDRHTGKVSAFNYLLFCISVVAILLTGGRAGFGGWAAGLLLVLLFGNSNYRFAAIFAGIVLSVVIYSFADSLVIFQRSSLEDTYTYRYAIWMEALEMFYRHPLFGIGIGNYRNYVSAHFPDQVWMVIAGEPMYFDHPESGYLKFLTENGVTGFTCIMLIILAPIFKSVRLFFKYRDTSLLFIIAAMISWLVGFYTLYSFSDIRMEVLIVTLIALLITSYKRIPLHNVA